MEEEKSLVIGQVEDAQIQSWKQSGHPVFQIELETEEGTKHVCYVKQPGRKELSAAFSLGAGDEFKIGEILFENCWLAGSDEIKKDLNLFTGAVKQLGSLVKPVTGNLQRL